jgi:hypothetical protein
MIKIPESDYAVLYTGCRVDIIEGTLCKWEKNNNYQIPIGIYINRWIEGHL